MVSAVEEVLDDLVGPGILGVDDVE